TSPCALKRDPIQWPPTGAVADEERPGIYRPLVGASGRGDRQLARIKYHSYPDGGLSEQMNGYTGFMQSARDLPRNYACILTELANRSTAAPGLLALKGRTLPLQPRTIPGDGLKKATLLKTQPAAAAARPDKPSGPGGLDDLSRRVKKLEETV